MQIIKLYRYVRDGGGITVSPVKPDGEDYAMRYRLIADDGKAITSGTIVTTCIDVESADSWYDIDAPQEKPEDDSGAITATATT